jgi:LysW-gamma-L-lysine carboxypeptidase
MNDAELLEAVVRIPSVTGQESEVVRFLQGQARADGFAVHEDGAGNFIAEAGTGPRRLLFVGHVDTVAGDIPVRVEKGALWGRGAVDAKGALLAAYCAARRHVGSTDVTLRIVGAVDEEGDSRGAKALADWPAAWIVVGEPSGVHGITVAYKGIVRGAFALSRARAHGGHPGPTAVEQAIALWEGISRRLRLADRFDTLQGHLLSLDTASDGLADCVTGRFQIRIPPGTSPDAVAADIEAVAVAAGARMAWGQRMAPAAASQRTSLAAAFRSAIREQGAEPRILCKTGTADFNLLAQRYPDTPIVAYGPGDAALDHTPGEHIVLADYEAAVQAWAWVIDRLRSVADRATPKTFTSLSSTPFS